MAFEKNQIVGFEELEKSLAAKSSLPVRHKSNTLAGLKVLGLVADDTACGRYRMIHPFQVLKEHGAMADWVRVASMQEMMQYDIIVAQRQYDPNVLKMLEQCMFAGKGGTYSTKILTPKGWTTFKDIQVGQEITSADGKTCKVTGRFERGVLPVYRITFSDGGSVLCDGEHLWKVSDIAQRWKITPTKEIAEKELKDSSGNKKFYVPLVEPVEFETKPSLPVDPYVIGVLLGDGALTHSHLNFAAPNLGIAREVLRALPKEATVNLLRANPDRCASFSIRFRNRKNLVYESLGSLGLRGLKSYEKFIPEEYLWASKEDRLSLLQGLMDTDGGIGEARTTNAEGNKHGNSVCFYSTSPMLAEAITFLVRSLGGRAKNVLSKERPSYWSNDEVKYGRPCYRVAIKMSNGVNPFRARAEEYIPPKDNPRRAIVSIEPEGEEPVVCISVDSSDHLYVTDDFIVTHNTVLYEVDDDLHRVLFTSPAYTIYHPSSDENKSVGDFVSRLYGCTVSTEDLHASYYRFNKNIHVLQNLIDFSLRNWEAPRTTNYKEGTVIVSWAGGTCLDDQTEILTNDGFKLFKDLDRTEEVATLNPENNKLEYHVPEEYTVAPYQGNLHVVEKHQVNYAVTPNHWMYVAKRKGQDFKKSTMQFEKIQSETLASARTRFFMKKDAIWEGVEDDQFAFSKDGASVEEQIEIPMDDWLKVFGFWLAEGYTTSNPNGHWQVGFVQKKYPQMLEDIAAILEKAGLNPLWYRNKTELKFCHKGLWTHLHTYCGVDAKTKKIPWPLLELTSRQIRILLDSYLMGDGSAEMGPGCVKPRLRAYTASPVLADQLVEIALKIGWSANLVNRGKRNGKIGDRVLTAKSDGLVVSFLRNDGRYNYLQPLVSPDEIKEVPYDGMVYCVTVKNHLIYVRRKGVCQWVGNTHQSDLEILDPVIPAILKKYPHVMWGMYTGMDLAQDFCNRNNIDPDRVHFEAPRHFLDYPEGLANFDIQLAPVVNCAFNACKSSLKVLESWAYSTPIVASKVAPYSRTMKDGHGGFLATDNPLEWVERISQLVEDEGYRKRMGEEGRELCFEEHNLDSKFLQWPEAWKLIHENVQAGYFGPPEIVETSKHRYQGSPYQVWGRIGRNDKCPCGSEKKYKNCCTPAWG